MTTCHFYLQIILQKLFYLNVFVLTLYQDSTYHNVYVGITEDVTESEEN